MWEHLQIGKLKIRKRNKQTGKEMKETFLYSARITCGCEN